MREQRYADSRGIGGERPYGPADVAEKFTAPAAAPAPQRGVA
jgi:hypothetical protein